MQDYEEVGRQENCHSPRKPEAPIHQVVENKSATWPSDRSWSEGAMAHGAPIGLAFAATSITVFPRLARPFAPHRAARG